MHLLPALPTFVAKDELLTLMKFHHIPRALPINLVSTGVTFSLFAGSVGTGPSRLRGGPPVFNASPISARKASPEAKMILRAPVSDRLKPLKNQNNETSASIGLAALGFAAHRRWRRQAG